MITGEESPAFIQDWLLASKDRLSGPGLEFLYLSTFACEVGHVATQAHEALRADDTDFISWTTTDLWTRLLSLRVTLDQALHTHPVGEIVNVENLHISNQYRTFYIRALQHVLELVETRQFPDGDGLPPDQSARISISIRNTMRSLVDGVLSTASLVLDSLQAESDRRSPVGKGRSKFTRPIYWCDALKQLWPLRILGARKYLLDEDQITSHESMLRRLSNDFCIRQAVAVYHPLDIASDK